MHRNRALAVALTVCAWAAGDVRVFVTSSASGCGLDLLGPNGNGMGTDPENSYPIDPFRPTYSTVTAGGDNIYAYDYYYAYYRAAAFPPIDAPSGTADDPILIDVAAGQWGYMWFQFRGEPKGAKVNGLVVEVLSAPQGFGPASDLAVTYYVQNDKDNPDFGMGAKRWDGNATAPDYPEWRNNPQTLIASTSDGIFNGTSDPELLFESQEGGSSVRTGVALLGAVQGVPGDTVYQLRIDAITYAYGSAPQFSEHAFFKIVPEPAALLLLAAGAIVTRRR
jgi:hypothetical protein